MRILLSFAPDLHLEPLGEGIDDRNAHTVEAACNLVGGTVELATGVQGSQYNLHRRPTRRLVEVHGDSAAVVHHRHAAIQVNGDLDAIAEACQRLIDAVIHHLIHQVVKPLRAGAADIHRRSLADGLQPFKDPDLLRAVTYTLLEFLSLFCHPLHTLLASEPSTPGQPKKIPPPFSVITPHNASRREDRGIKCA